MPLLKRLVKKLTDGSNRRDVINGEKLQIVLRGGQEKKIIPTAWEDLYAPKKHRGWESGDAHVGTKL